MYNKSCMVKINKSTVMDFIIPVTVNGCGHGDMVAVMVKRGIAVMETCPVMVEWSARKLRCDIAAAWSVGMSASIYALDNGARELLQMGNDGALFRYI